MANNRYDETALKETLKEIIDQDFVSKIQEMKKKLTVAMIREQDHQDRLDKYEEELKALKKCHTCHNLIVVKRDAYTQTKQTSTSPKASASRPCNPLNETPMEYDEITKTTQTSDHKQMDVVDRRAQTPKPPVNEPELICIDDSD